LPACITKIRFCCAKEPYNHKKDCGTYPLDFWKMEKRLKKVLLEKHTKNLLAHVEITKLHVVFSLPKVNQVYLHFLAKMKDEQFGPTAESTEVQLFDIDEIPWGDIAFHSSTYALEKFIEFGEGYSGVHVGSYDGKQKWEVD
jgi:hypothetical protein